MIDLKNGKWTDFFLNITHFIRLNYEKIPFLGDPFRPVFHPI